MKHKINAQSWNRAQVNRERPDGEIKKRDQTQDPDRFPGYPDGWDKTKPRVYDRH